MRRPSQSISQRSEPPLLGRSEPPLLGRSEPPLLGRSVPPLLGRYKSNVTKDPNLDSYIVGFPGRVINPLRMTNLIQTII